MPDNFNIDDILAEYAGGKKQSSASGQSTEKKATPQPQGISATSILKSLDEKDKPAQPKESKPAEQKPAADETAKPKRPDGTRPRRPRPEGAAAPDGTRPRRPRPEGAPAPDGTRPRRPRPEGAPAPDGTRPRRPRPEGAAAPDGTRPRRPRPEGAPAPDGTRPRRPRPDGAAAPDGTRPRRPRPDGAAAPDGTRPRRPRPEGAAAPDGTKQPADSAKKPETKEKNKLTDKLFGKNKNKTAAAAAAATATAAAPAQTKIVIKDGMSIIDKAKQYRFLFEELTKRDFKKKYKRAVLGIAWSVLSPFMNFLVYLFVFSYLFQRNMEHFSIYIMTGSLMFSFFTTSTNAGMFSMYSNAGVMSKIKVPKTIFLLSSNVACIFNFLLTMIVYFIFVAIDGLPFGPHMLMILYPIICLTVFNIGVGYILSSLFVFFRDIQYLYSIFTQLLTFLSAIFYTVDRFPEDIQIIFAINPIYRYITYVRQIVIDGAIPDLTSHLVCLGAAAIVFALGYFIHKKTEQKFVYYF